MEVPIFDPSKDELIVGLMHFVDLKVDATKDESVKKENDGIGSQKAPLLSDVNDLQKQNEINDLVSRVEKLELDYVGAPSNKNLSKSEIASIIRAKNAVDKTKSYSSVWKWVPLNYYSLQLEERAKILGAHDKMQLCKALLFENKAIKSSSFDRRNAQFYLVIVQYGAEINTKKLEVEVRAFLPLQDRLEPSKYDFRIASAEDNDRLTGYIHNSVTPFGLSSQDEVPIILASAIKQNLKFMYMGGGHVDLKLGMAVQDFIDGTNCFVVDISDAR